MNKLHQELLEELKRHTGTCTKEQLKRLQSYMGTTKFCSYIKSGTRVKIIKDWMKRHRDLSSGELTDLLNSLYKGKSHDERLVAGKLLEFLPKLRKDLDPQLIDRWLNSAEGWGEVDSLCQSNFTAEELLGNWGIWQKLIKKFSLDENIHKRRASLVLLTKSAGHSSNEKISQLAFQLINQLRHEKDILITKAISWLLRSLIKLHKNEVAKYLKENKATLPSIALRETEHKLLTGKKYVRHVK